MIEPLVTMVAVCPGSTGDKIAVKVTSSVISPASAVLVV